MKSKINTIRLRRLGKVATPDLNGFPGTYMQTPTPLVLPDRIRVFVSTRLEGRAVGAYVDLEPTPPFSVMAWSKSPIMTLGKLGTFDDEGVMPAYCMADPGRENRILMFVSGWNTRNTIRYHNATGIQFSDDLGLSWSRETDGPVLDRTAQEPYLAVTPWIVEVSQEMYRCWYISGLEWRVVNDVPEPVYVIKSATSTNLLDWKRDGLQVVQSHFSEECFSRPSVSVRADGQFLMLFCSRSIQDYRSGDGAYSLGAAISSNSVTWDRIGVELEGALEPWETTMQAYPAWFETADGKYVLYNGNGFGQTGFGILKYVDE